MNQTNFSSIDQITKTAKPGAKILFANFPADGHFNPLTGIAFHLKSLGYDVRWYTSFKYADKIKRLDIPHYPLKKALDISAGEIDDVFPERKNHKGKVAKLSYDLIHAFILRAPEYYEDIKEIYKSFTFDLLIADVAFTGLPFVKELMNVPAIAIGIIPIPETSKDLPPTGLGMMPSNTFFGRLKQAFLRFVADKVLFKKPNEVLYKLLNDYGITPEGNLFDTNVRKATLLLQSGTPGFEYYRSDLSKNVRFVGALLPYTKKKTTTWFDDKLLNYDKVILVTQGTVETDINKIIVPTLEAFKNSEYLVIATTGGSGTTALKARYSQENIIIEDFIPFDDIMPYADVYITNGGYGGVMLGIQNNLPLVVAGVHEGKSEINARIGYFKLGINLKTEKPTPDQVKNAVQEIFNSRVYAENVTALNKEFSTYNPQELCASYVAEILGVQKPKRVLQV